MENLILFLGSGISYLLGSPTVNKITKNLFEREWHSHTNQAFYPGENPSVHFRPDNWVPRIQEFLRIVYSDVETYLKERSDNFSPTYEDLFYLIQQIHYEVIGEIDNPAISPYVNQLKLRTNHICCSTIWPKDEIDLAILADRTCDFIQWVVYHSLYPQKDPEGMDLIYDLSIRNEIKKLTIATLNHDLLIEKKLMDIPYIDGFSLQEGEIRYFDGKLFKKDDTKVFLLKLHGSLNWYPYRRIRNGEEQDIYGIPINNDPEHAKDIDGKYAYNLGGKPAFLTGTYNKQMSYVSGVIGAMHHQFYLALQNTNSIIMSGYGWNDRGINHTLFNWLYSTKENRIILLHQNPEKIKNSKSAMCHRYNELVEKGKLILIRKWLSEISMSEIQEIL